MEKLPRNARRSGNDGERVHVEGRSYGLQPDGGAACRLNVRVVAMTTSLLDGATYYVFFFFFESHLDPHKKTAPFYLSVRLRPDS